MAQDHEKIILQFSTTPGDAQQTMVTMMPVVVLNTVCSNITDTYLIIAVTNGNPFQARDFGLQLLEELKTVRVTQCRLPEYPIRIPRCCCLRH